jgi:nucleoside-diphosphate-sugar epimerase
MRRTAIVTGAAGFIGSTLTDRLLSEGWLVVGIDSFEDYYPRQYKERNLALAIAHPNFTLIERSILSLAAEQQAFDSLVSSADVVFHLAAQAGVRGSWGTSFSIYTDNNILGTQLLLESAMRTGLAKFVYASSSSVYGDTDVLPMREDARCRPFSPYGVSKLAGEHLCYLYWRNFSVETVALRFFTVYGPRQRPDMGFHKFIRAVLEERPIVVFGDGAQTRDFTFVTDIVDGLVAAAGAPGGSIFNLGGGSRVSLSSVLDTLGSVMGVPVQIDRTTAQAGDVRHTAADLSAARSALAYRPSVGLAEGLRRQVDWLRALHADEGYPWGYGA